MKQKVLLLMALLVSSLTTWAWDGYGTEESPYLIKSADDWNTLATNVNGGTTYSGMYFKQTANISISTMVGDVSNSKYFSGTYDGDGHTITASINIGTDEYAAPFRYINGATLKNFTVAGTVRGHNYSAAVVSYASGTNTISNVIATAAVAGIGNYCGGFVGHGHSSTTTFNGCVFAGSFTDNGATVGVFMGDCSSPTLNITNCLEATSSCSATNFSPIGQTTGSPTVTITNTYYKNAVKGETEHNISGGKQAYTITGATGVTVANTGTETTYNVSGITSYGIGIKYNDVLYGGNGDEVNLSLTGGTTGSFTSTTGTLNGAALTMVAADAYIFAGSGASESDPILIGSTADWNTLATAVSGGNTYSYIKQTANINVSSMVGTSSNKFSGTYNGGGYTITASISVSDEVQYAAPFSYINGATLKNFTVAGTVSGANFTSAVVGYASGTNTISNVIATATVNCSAVYSGGLVGHGQVSNTTLEGCVFAGNFYFTGSSNHYVGALWGLSSDGATLTITNCMEATANYLTTYFDPIGLFENTLNVTINNTYYQHDASGELGTAATSISGGKKAYTITGATGVTVANAGSATEYNVSGITSYGTGIKYNDALYGGSEDAVSLTLTSNYSAYTSSNGSLTGSSNPYTLTMTAANALISPTAFAATANADPATSGVFYTTFYDSSRKYLLPEGVEAYVGTVSGNKLTLTKIAYATQTIPKNTAVILKSNSSNYTMNVSTSDPVSEGSNDLLGVDEATATSTYSGKYIYTLAAVDNVVGFYKYTGSTLAANKAFLALESAVSARGFVFSFEDVTGIRTIDNEQLIIDNSSNGQYYNLNGQKVDKPTKGLYIVNGKKVIIK